MPKRDTKPEIKITPPNIRSNIRAMIKVMIGEFNRADEQKPRRLLRVDLALDMQDREGHILDTLYWCADNQVSPTRDNVVNFLKINRRMGETPNDYIDALIEEHKDDEAGVSSLCAFVFLWLQERQLASQGQRILDIANDPMMDYVDKWDASFEALMKVSPNDSFAYESLGEEAFKNVAFAVNQEAVKARKEGRAIGPQFPFEALNAYFPALGWGQVTLITATKGMGKTTLAQITAENVSWNQNIKTDTHLISLETPVDVMSVRQFARHSLVPYNAIVSGDVDLDDLRWKPLRDAWMALSRQRANDYGYIRVSFSPGADVNDILALMIRSSDASQALGRRCVFIIDHLHSIEWQRTHAELGEYGARRAIFEMLAAQANKLSLRNPNHLIVFAQEGSEKGQTFGGKFQSRRAQYVFSLNRETFGTVDENGDYPLAKESLPIEVPFALMSPEQKANPALWSKNPKKNDSVFLLDALGNQRFWYRAGDKYQHIASMNAIWGNNNALGKTDLLFEGAMARLTQDMQQVAKMRADGVLPPLPRLAPKKP